MPPACSTRGKRQNFATAPLRTAQELGFVRIEERRVSAWRNAPNVVTITSREWTTWLRMRQRGVGSKQEPPRIQENNSSALAQQNRGSAAERQGVGRAALRPNSRKVLGEHRYVVADPVGSGEAGEQGDADVHHPLGLRDHDGASSEPRQPMPLAGVVPLNPMRLLLARVQLSDRQEHAIDGVVVR